jgi:hypothetical protein
LLLAILLLAAPCAALANGHEPGGGDLPLYARIEHGNALNDGKWAFVVFYRPPECVPPDFNLLDLFDWEGAWGCLPVTTDGFFVMHKDLPGPIQQKLHGLGAVPVWFVKVHEIEAAMADEVLTIGELGALPSLARGSAAFYEEILHPSFLAKVAQLQLNGSGLLENGLAFRVHASATERGGYTVRVTFR